MFAYPLFPPELNSALMYTGPRSGPMLAAAAAWDSLAADLSSAATAYQSVIANLVGGPWQGPSAMAMAGAAAPYVGWMHATAAQAEQAGLQAKTAAGAYEAAFAMTVPPPVIAANRALLMTLVATNFLGQNTPAIAATEAHYAEMWAQDVAAMSGYQALSQQATAALPAFSDAPPTTSAAALPGALAPVASGSTNLLGALAQLPQLISSLPTTLEGLAASIPGVSSVVQLLNSLGLGSLSSSSAIQGVYLASIPARFAMYPMSMLMQLARMGQMGTAGMMPGAGGSEVLMNSIGQFVDGKMQLVVGNVANQLRTWGSTITAQLGQAHTVGGLSVPHAWSEAAPAMSRAAPVLPDTTVSAPAVTTSAGMPGGPFSQALMGALSGRGIGGLAAKVPAKVVPRPAAGG